MQLLRHFQHREMLLAFLRNSLSNSERTLSRFAGCFEPYKRIVSLLSQNEVPRLRSLLSHLLEKGWSINSILQKLGEAIDGCYHPKGYTTEDIQLGTLVLRIGGPQLVHVLHQKKGFPGLSHLKSKISNTPKFFINYDPHEKEPDLSHTT
eukprot:Pompholyxophrys_punicea_v1_NODE_36_length_4801_cov_3.930257.p4 type:complete len:150 gc:universal NODE_36_length_4801_cov_3.930257:1430-1879(+)